MVLLFASFYLLAILVEQATANTKKYVLMTACLVLVIMAGTRDAGYWPDTGVYIMSFEDYTPSLFKLNKNSEPFGYSERGFYLLGSFFKIFSSSSVGYLTFIAAVSFVFLYKDFQRYCYYPLFGLCTYISRFYLARNLIQIRAGLSYAIILWGVQYITARDWKRYFFWVFIAYLFHTSALIAVPLYFLCLLKIRKKHIIAGIIIAFVITTAFAGAIKGFIGDASTDLNVATTYTTEEYTREIGLANPMIYFQLTILLAYTFGEKKLQKLSEDYYTIRNAYFYSTFILISLSMYTALSGRTSSMFATLEMAIIPAIINTFNRNVRWIAYVGMGVALTAIFFLNYAGGGK